MAYTVDSSGDHAFVDGVESVTYTPVGGSGASNSAKRADATNPDFSGQFGLSPTALVWTVWRATAAVGDTITDAGSTVYTVTNVVGIRPDGSQVTVATIKQA